MLIYRVENSKGKGPFSAFGWRANDRHIGIKYPEPSEEKLAISQHDYLGCATLRLIRHWFVKKERIALSKQGFSLTIYKCHKKRVKIGKYQLVFPKGKAILIERKNLIDFKSEPC